MLRSNMFDSRSARVAEAERLDIGSNAGWTWGAISTASAPIPLGRVPTLVLDAAALIESSAILDSSMNAQAERARCRVPERAPRGAG
jgi:hypothetical protein